MTPHSAVVGFVRTSCRGGSRALKKMNEEEEEEEEEEEGSMQPHSLVDYTQPTFLSLVVVVRYNSISSSSSSSNDCLPR